MFLTLLLLQVALPAALLLWLGLRPLASRVGLVIQVAATAIVLLALALTGLWLFPPWWMPAVYAALFAAAFFFRRTAPGTRLAWPRDPMAWAALLGLLGLGGFAAREAAGSLADRREPEGTVVALDFPLPPGTYLVLNGGSGVRLNAHVKTLDTTVARFRPWRGQSFGIDLVRVDRLGFRADGILPADPARYRIFGTPVLAPCHGRVITAVDGLPDQPVPEPDPAHRAGNHLILRCEGIDVVLAHFRLASVIPQPGDSVERGTVIGAVGNSGASDEPHLHIHAQRPGTAEAPLGGEPLPIRLGGRFLLRNQRVGVD